MSTCPRAAPRRRRTCERRQCRLAPARGRCAAGGHRADGVFELALGFELRLRLLSTRPEDDPQTPDVGLVALAAAAALRVVRHLAVSVVLGGPSPRNSAGSLKWTPVFGPPAKRGFCVDNPKEKRRYVTNIRKKHDAKFKAKRWLWQRCENNSNCARVGGQVRGVHPSQIFAWKKNDARRRESWRSLTASPPRLSPSLATSCCGR